METQAMTLSQLLPSFFRQGQVIQPRLASCLKFLSTGITEVCHYAQVLLWSSCYPFEFSR